MKARILIISMMVICFITFPVAAFCGSETIIENGNSILHRVVNDMTDEVTYTMQLISKDENASLMFYADGGFSVTMYYDSFKLGNDSSAVLFRVGTMEAGYVNMTYLDHKSIVYSYDITAMNAILSDMFEDQSVIRIQVTTESGLDKTFVFDLSTFPPVCRKFLEYV